MSGHLATVAVEKAMPPIDYMGPTGGALGISFASGFLLAWTVAGVAARWFWALFGDKRIKELQDQIERLGERHAAELAAERKRCDEQMALANHRIATLEGVLLASGPPALRQAMQAAVSEIRVDQRGD